MSVLYRKCLDFLYPSKCFFCALPLEDGSIFCEGCRKRLRRVEFPFCECCGEPFEGLIRDRFDCPNCRGLEMGFDFALASLCSSVDATEIVHALKYRRQSYLAQSMAELMVEAFCKDLRFGERQWLVVPVPLHWGRRIRRGFNQAEELAFHFARMMDFTMVRMLVRNRITYTQTALGRNKRIQNLKGSFRFKNSRIARGGGNILLIDDVLTTGSTARECAQTLKRETQVDTVAVLTFMRG